MYLMMFAETKNANVCMYERLIALDIMDIKSHILYKSNN